MLPVDFPKPRADQVSTAYPSRASRSAWGRRSFLLAPKPWASSTAGRRPAESPPAVKKEVSIRTSFLLPGFSGIVISRSVRWTAGAASEEAAAQVPPPMRTASAPAAAYQRRPRSRIPRRAIP